MNFLGFTITRSRSGESGGRQIAVADVTKAVPPNLSPVTGSGWFWPLVRESFLGAWQQNTQVDTANVLTYAAVYACVTLIASDIGKLRIKLMRQLLSGIWEETESPAFSPFLKKQNRYQTRIMFLQNWMTSKLIWGNTYILKQRDERNVVTNGYILDPQRVKVLVSESGDIWYELQADNLAGLKVPDGRLIVPAREIIHDVMVPLYHPLIGVSPLTACGLAAMQGLRIQDDSSTFFGNGSRPGGVLTAPGAISDATATRLKAYFDANFSGTNSGKVAVVGDGLKYEQMMMSATDAQLIEQLRWTAENVCTAFHVPPYMIGVGSPPTYNNIEALNAQYYTQCLQNPIEHVELLLDEGLGLVDARDPAGRPYGTELELDDLLRMDSATRMSVAEKAIKSGVSPNEVREKYHDLGPVTGGDAVYLQQQNFSVEALAKRDAKEDPFAAAKPKTPTLAAPVMPPAVPKSVADDPESDMALHLMAKALMADELKAAGL